MFFFCLTDYQRLLPIPQQLSRPNSDLHHHHCEDMLPPPSPVSSSYSELRRAVDNQHYPAMKLYPPSYLHHHTYANMYHNDCIYPTYQASSIRTVRVTHVQKL